MEKKKIDYRQIFIESLFIVFAVSLAFSMSEWRQDFKTKQLVKRVTQTLKDEISANKAELESSYEYRLNLLDELKKGTHLINAFPVSYFDFDHTNDEKLSNFISQSFVDELQYAPENITIERRNGNRYLIIGKSINRLQTENDSIKVYGNGNIILKSANLSNNSWQIANATNAVVEMDYEVVLLLGEINTLITNYNNTSEKAIDILYSENGNITSVLEDMRWMEKILLEKHESILNSLN
jgi:hypothetical protein